MNDKKTQTTAEIINPSLAEIDKVRDILFGKYVEQFEVRVQQLEARMEKDLEKLKAKIEARLQELDTALESASDRFNQSIQLTEDQMVTELNQLQQEVSEANASLKATIDSTAGQLDDRKLNRESLASLLDQVAVKLRAND